MGNVTDVKTYDLFLAAFRHCWDREGDRYGKQSTFGEEIVASQGMISAVLKGRRTASLDLQERIAAAFGYDHIGFLSLGKSLLAQKTNGTQPANKPSRSEVSVIDERLVRVPVFDANCGSGVSWTDGGFPVGEASDYIWLPESDVDENTFSVLIHSDSMEPYLPEGSKVVVVPSAPLVSGKLCYAVWPGDDGEKVVKRYREMGATEKTIILESDNRKYDPIILTPDNGKGVRIYRVTKSVRDE